jgi:hypothetical protein
MDMLASPTFYMGTDDHHALGNVEEVNEVLVANRVGAALQIAGTNPCVARQTRTLLWRRLLVSHSAVSRMVLSASFPGFRNTSRRS